MAIVHCFTHRKQQKMIKVILLRAPCQNVNVLLSDGINDLLSARHSSSDHVIVFAIDGINDLLCARHSSSDHIIVFAVCPILAVDVLSTVSVCVRVQSFLTLLMLYRSGWSVSLRSLSMVTARNLTCVLLR